MEFLYATHNQNKVNNMEKILKDNNVNIKLHTVKEINFNQDIIEDGNTFEENSEIKARAIEKYCKENNIQEKIIIADDAGLCVDKLNGEPGIYSARYAGENATQSDCINKVLDKMKEYNDMDDRTCKFVCVLTAIITNTGEKIVARGECKGRLPIKPGKICGLTYSPIFIPEGFDVPMTDMEDMSYTKVPNHRSLAMNKLLEELKNRNII